MLMEFILIFIAGLLSIFFFFILFLQKNVTHIITKIDSTVYLFSIVVSGTVLCCNLNNYFVTLTLLSFLIPSFVMFFYNLHRPITTRLKINLANVLIFLSLVFILESTNVIIIVFGFELIVFVTLYLLVITIKTDRGITAVLELFIWAILGSFFLLLGVTFYVSSITIATNFLTKSTIEYLGLVLLVLGFAVKIPMWPFTSWLLKAHVEASTEFSIFLSGFLVKFGVVVLWKLSTIFLFSHIETVVLALSTCGLISAALTLLYQIDIKKIVALCTVIEMNWLVFMLFSNFDVVTLKLSLVLMLIHATMTVLEFYSVDILYRVYNSRNYFDISGFYYTNPTMSTLLWCMVFVIIGVPGTSVFFCKLFFFVLIAQNNIIIYWLWCFIFFVYLPIFFMKLWSNMLGAFSSSKPTSHNSSLSSSYDLFLFILCLTLNIILGSWLYYFL